MSGPSSTQQFEWANNVPCRNIQIYGFCKWANKGCSFNHDAAGQSSQQQSQQIPPPTSGSGEMTTASSMLGLSGASRSATKPGIVITSKANPNVPLSFSEIAKSSSQINLNHKENDASANGSTSSKKKFNFHTPSFNPTASLATKLASVKVSPNLNEIPSFVPGSASSGAQSAENNVRTPILDTHMNSSSVSMAPTPSSSFNPETAPWLDNQKNHFTCRPIYFQ
ncbi:unnamed protein product [Ambrosiozyma monospora]|uniref:Unnamed protein product n=1 Tax=Ambrosiozyma monospora TaxID=43982 RepID=A0ACB5TGF3_AMBMO|nr:unnamed protein product [Ambrosiozyma monospora]